MSETEEDNMNHWGKKRNRRKENIKTRRAPTFEVGVVWGRCFFLAREFLRCWNQTCPTRGLSHTSYSGAFCFMYSSRMRGTYKFGENLIYDYLCDILQCRFCFRNACYNGFLSILAVYSEGALHKLAGAHYIAKIGGI